MVGDICDTRVQLIDWPHCAGLFKGIGPSTSQHHIKPIGC
jgi:hypothetical protein